MKQKNGFTIIELLITLAITGIIFTVVGGLIFQLNTATDYGNSKLTVCHEMQNLSNRFYLDGYEAVSADGSSALNLKLTSGQSVTYALSGTSLIRTQDNISAVLAQNVSDLKFTLQERLITMNIKTSTPGRMGETEEATYKVYIRSKLQ
jgi:prepilin-type N-terminal cleavage/methylation domain-containing protein